MLRIATYAGITVTSFLLMTSTSFAQSFCSDVDRVVKLAPLGFRAILDDADRDPVQRRVTQRLPGASMCWYDNGSRSYWCSWNVPSSQTASQATQLASAIAHCYQTEPEFEPASANGTTPDQNEVSAIIDLPDSISIYINGAFGTVAMSVTATDALDEMARHLEDGSGKAIDPTGQGDRAPARSSPGADSRNDEVLSGVPDELGDLANSVPFARLPARPPATQDVPEEPVSPPLSAREVDGVRSPRDGSIVMPHSHGTSRR
jgi:hypothetical protein